MMPDQCPSEPESMLDVVGRALAEGADFKSEQDRYRRLALAALRPLAQPTKGMIYAAHAAVEFDALWAINTSQDFARAVEAMIEAVMKEEDVGLGPNPAGEWYP